MEASHPSGQTLFHVVVGLMMIVLGTWDFGWESELIAVASPLISSETQADIAM